MNWCRWILCFSIVVIPSAVLGEELLIKKEAKYLGWRAGVHEFTTCARNVLKIGDGEIRDTDEKCENRPGPSPFMSRGTVESVNLTGRALLFKDASGEKYYVHYPQRAEAVGNVRLMDLRTGDKVSVIGPVKGRAEMIKLWE